MLSVLFWGYSFISTKIVLAELPPISIAFFRQIIASVSLMSWLLLTKSFKPIPIKQLAPVAVSGFFGIVLYFVLENTGLRYTTASNASMIVAAVPVFTLLTEAIFYKLKISVRMVMCVIMSITGVYLVISVNGRLDISSETFLGNMLVMGAKLAWVIYTILNKNLSEKYPGPVLPVYQFMISILLFTPLVIPEIPKWTVISPASLINLLYLGILCSACSYFFYIYEIGRAHV